ncbi:MAG: hypothetical protein LUH14_01190 [Clostridiaceae bacterium]|nr:hypothetical protein [Clostridiaceae bacterium]
MPNRILKESICRSEEIDSLSWFEEVLFYRLIVICDDFGRYDGRAKIIKGSCFPLKDVTEKDIDKALGKLAAVGLVRVYEAQGRPYLQLVTWADHQRIRNQKSKYPEFAHDCKLLLSNDSNGQQETVMDNKCVRNPIQSESKSESESNPDICSEPQAAAEPEEMPVITLLLNTGEEYRVMQKDVEEWMGLYPAVDVMQELRSMKGWCLANPTKRKTARGVTRFINSWLAKAQNSGGTPGYRSAYNQSVAGGSRVEQFAHGAREWANE